MAAAHRPAGRLPFPPGLQAFLEGKLPPGPPPTPRPAATVALVRDGDNGLETFLVRRARGMKFLGGAHVFPGGRVDESDAGPEAAAVREVREEVAVELDPAALRPWSRWITPEVETRRFDARFYVAPLPEGQQARAVEGELVEGCWYRPADAVAHAHAGRIVLAPPTLWTLLEL
ncbi:MAG: NUDIX domain-containing protein, partial [Planctomycetota bacterium]